MIVAITIPNDFASDEAYAQLVAAHPGLENESETLAEAARSYCDFEYLEECDHGFLAEIAQKELDILPEYFWRREL